MNSCSLFIAISFTQIREPWIYFVIRQSRSIAQAYTSAWLRIFKLWYRMKYLRWTWRRAYYFSVLAWQLSLTKRTQYRGLAWHTLMVFWVKLKSLTFSQSLYDPYFCHSCMRWSKRLNTKITCPYSSSYNPWVIREIFYQRIQIMVWTITEIKDLFPLK